MTAKRLDGRILAAKRGEELAERVGAARARGLDAPRLAVVLGTEDEVALAYFRSKQRTAEKIGIRVDGVRLAEPTTDRMTAAVRDLAADPAVHGILVETPVPSNVDLRRVQDAVPPEKDVDGASTMSLGRLFSGRPTFVPATAAAVMALLAGHGIDLRGAHAVVVGRSLVVGRPLSQLLLAQGATVTVCHSQTRNLAEHTRSADIVCVAVGHPRFLGAEAIRPGSVVVDVGMNLDGDALVGDVDFDGVSEVAGWASPVPGGVGPLTTVLLMDHVVQAAHALTRTP